MAAFRYTAGLRGTTSGEVDEEEIERREAMKKLRRRPLSETLEQLGEGRGKCGRLAHSGPIVDELRYLRPRVRGEKATEDPGEVRHRCKGSAGLDATHNFLGVYTRSRHRPTRIEHFTTLVHTNCPTRSKMTTSSSSIRIVSGRCALNRETSRAKSRAASADMQALRISC